jgi:enoyl-CoA hydratase/carnithine racemase
VSDRVSCSIDDGVAHVRLTRPDKLNALDRPMVAAIVAAGEQVRTDRRVRAVVLSGEGRGFCAGLDLSSFRAMARAGQDPDGGAGGLLDVEPGQVATLAQRVAWVWQEVEVPVIAAVHGVALGGGLQLALGADIRIVTPDAKLAVLEVQWGLIPDMTGTQVLPALVGLDVAKELTFTGRTVDGIEAAAIGLATRVSPTALDDAVGLARTIAGRSPDAVAEAKRLLNLAGRVTPAAGFAEEARAQRALIGGGNQVEAVLASFEGRDPRFADRE